MSQIYFFSDVHLGADSGSKEQEKIRKLISFLHHVQSTADIIYIVGDLYDFWFEYRNAIPKVNLKVLRKLHELVEAGVEIHYLLGNHDLWQDGFLEQEIGLKIHTGPLAVEHNSLKLFIAHGDGLIERDWVTRLRNRIFKSRFNIFLYRLLPPDAGIPLAKFVAKKSRERGEREKNPFDREYRNFALQKLDESFDAVILGHTHKPLFEVMGAKYYVNLGEWGKQFKFLELTGHKFELKTWPLGTVKKQAAGKLTGPSQV